MSCIFIAGVWVPDSSPGGCDQDPALTLISTRRIDYGGRASSQQVHVTPVGFEPTQLALVELESTPLDHSGKVSWIPDGLIAAIWVFDLSPRVAAETASSV